MLLSGHALTYIIIKILSSLIVINLLERRREEGEGLKGAQLYIFWSGLHYYIMQLMITSTQKKSNFKVKILKSKSSN